jgi:sugar phosphate isomerase/epimerase
MKLMMCMTGEPLELRFLPEIAALGAGLELGSYGMIGIQSEQNWDRRLALHQAVRAEFPGTIAIHGPFIGMEYGHIDHLIQAAVNRRLDMTFEVALKLRASRLILHSGYTPLVDLFQLQDSWFKTNVAFWRREIRRWADAGIEIALENDVDKTPDMIVRVVDEVSDPFLGLCLDIGHLNVYSALNAVEWVRRCAHRLLHIHLHDNDGSADSHWALGRGTIDFEPFYAALLAHAPGATLAVEVVDDMQLKMNDLRKIATRFAINVPAPDIS